MNPCRPSRLRQIRARKSSGHYVGGRKLFQADDISAKVHARKTFPQDGPCRFPFFAQKFSAGTTLMKTEFKSAYTREQSRNGKCRCLRLYLGTHHT